MCKIAPLSCAVLLAGAIGGGSACRAQEIFATTGQDVPVADAPFSVVFGDVDLDGDPDLVAATLYGGVSVRLGDGTGVFSVTGQNVPVGDDPESVALGDLDLDGDLDLVAANRGSATCSTRLNDGLGTFDTTGQELVVGSVWSVVLEDIDLDGDLDLIAATSAGVKVHMGDGAGLFDPAGQQVPVGGDAYSVALGDLDLDGDLDLVTANYTPMGPGTCGVRLNEGSGVFATTGQEVPVGAGPHSVALGDLDLDGDLDLVTANGSESTCSVRLGDGAGGFSTTGQEVPIESSSLSVALGDVNDDGFLDVVAANLWDSTCSVRLNDGTGLLSSTGQAVPIGPWLGIGPLTSLDFTIDVTLHDLDLDGDLDLACTFIFGFGDDFVGVRLNLFTGFRRGDSNADGAIDLADPVYVLSYLFHGGSALSCEDSGDLNDDGALDVADPVYALWYQFSGGPPPAEPLSDCGGDPTPDALGCEPSAGCP